MVKLYVVWCHGNVTNYQLRNISPFIFSQLLVLRLSSTYGIYYLYYSGKFILLFFCTLVFYSVKQCNNGTCLIDMLGRLNQQGSTTYLQQMLICRLYFIIIIIKVNLLTSALYSSYFFSPKVSFAFISSTVSSSRLQNEDSHTSFQSLESNQ
jgi:hypothetical protein